MATSTPSKLGKLFNPSPSSKYEGVHQQHYHDSVHFDGERGLLRVSCERISERKIATTLNHDCVIHGQLSFLLKSWGKWPNVGKRARKKRRVIVLAWRSVIFDSFWAFRQQNKSSNLKLLGNRGDVCKSGVDKLIRPERNDFGQINGRVFFHRLRLISSPCARRGRKYQELTRYLSLYFTFHHIIVLVWTLEAKNTATKILSPEKGGCYHPETLSLLAGNAKLIIPGS